tara:strand:+ start:4050 stop:4217 length:168 start_codon:yes stop_codon:yes gene_type:complete
MNSYYLVKLNRSTMGTIVEATTPSEAFEKFVKKHDLTESDGATVSIQYLSYFLIK